MDQEEVPLPPPGGKGGIRTWSVVLGPYFFGALISLIISCGSGRTATPWEKNS